MRNSRKAALHIHGLDNEDRNWMLSQVSKPQSRELLVLLNELDEIGVPRERILFDSQLDGTDDSYDNRLSKAIVELECASSEKLEKLILLEPIDAVAILLNYRNWAWKDWAVKLLARCEIVAPSQELLMTDKLRSMLIIEFFEYINSKEFSELEIPGNTLSKAKSGGWVKSWLK